MSGKCSSGPPTECCLNMVHSLLALLHPLDRIWGSLFSEISQWAGDIRIIRQMVRPAGYKYARRSFNVVLYEGELVTTGDRSVINFGLDLQPQLSSLRDHRHQRNRDPKVPPRFKEIKVVYLKCLTSIRPSDLTVKFSHSPCDLKGSLPT
ncbi:hypothetical protein AOLI_G00103200 [Acnodon oligacanthus]